MTSRTFDYRPRFDERSKAFRLGASRRQEAPVPRTWDCPVWFDQGSEGACTGFAMTHLLATAPTPKTDTSKELATRIYSEAKLVDEWPGESYEGSSVLAAAKVAKREGWIEGYEWSMGVEDVLHALSVAGPVVLGIQWLQSMMEPSKDGLLRVSGPVSGGHAILARGHEVRFVDGSFEHVVILRNSWGRSWGVDGDCFIRVADLDRLLRDDGEACVPVGTASDTLAV